MSVVFFTQVWTASLSPNTPTRLTWSRLKECRALRSARRRSMGMDCLWRPMCLPEDFYSNTLLTVGVAHLRGRCSNGPVSFNVDEGDKKCVIDPRMSGNNAKYPNHSCNPNCILMKVAVRDRYIFYVLVLRPLNNGTDYTVNFGRKKRGTWNRIICNCQSPVCAGYVWG